MILQEELILQEYQKNLVYLKFMRRPDITPAMRLYIGGLALFNSSKAQTEELMQKYNISRSFVYHLRHHLLVHGCFIFGQAEDLNEAGNKEMEESLHLLRSILSLRLEGRCSIISISLLLKRQGLKGSSIGYISEVLKKAGGKLDKVVDLEAGVQIGVVFASDEVFSKGRPLLITIDPVSSAILHLELGKDRSGDSWAAHWQALLDAGIYPLLLTSDGGTGLKNGRNSLPALAQVGFQPDTFHALAHRLGDTRRILCKKGWIATTAEYKSELKFESQEEEEDLAVSIVEYEAALAASKAAVNLYDDYRIYYRYLLEQLYMFDEQGNIRRSKQSQANIEQAIQALASLDHPATNSSLKTIKKLLDNGLLNFQEEASKVVYHLEQSCSSGAQRATLKMICRAYHYQKRLRKAKNRKKKAYFKTQQIQWLSQAKACWEQTKKQNWTFGVFQEYVYSQLAQVVQSSSLVETINSIVRLYLNNAKNQITQEHLNLVMFYHNHRRYVQGVRKNHTPMELLTGQKQKEDWLDLLLKKVYSSKEEYPELHLAHLSQDKELPTIEVNPRKMCG